MNLLTTIPDWAVTSEAKAFWLGIGAGIIIRLVRTALRWFKRVSNDDFGGGD